MSSTKRDLVTHRLNFRDNVLAALVGIFLVVAVVSIYQALVRHDATALAVTEQEQQKAALEAKIAQQMQQLNDLSDDKNIEAVIREELGLVKEGEIPYLIEDPQQQQPFAAHPIGQDGAGSQTSGNQGAAGQTGQISQGQPGQAAQMPQVQPGQMAQNAQSGQQGQRLNNPQAPSGVQPVEQDIQQEIFTPKHQKKSWWERVLEFFD